MNAKENSRRLKLLRWASRNVRGIARENVEELVLKVERLQELVAKLASQDEKIETLEAELKEAKELAVSLEQENDAYADSLERELLRVKYWLHDGIVLGKLVSNPRELLRSVEEVLG